MQFYIAAVMLTLSASAYAQQTDDPAASAVASKFSSAVSQLVSLYIPSGVKPVFASVASAQSITGTDINAILESAFTATSAPAWLTAIPTEYSSNVVALESKVSELRSAASVGTIPGASQVVTNTDGGRTVVTTLPPSGTTTTGGSHTGSATSGATSTTLSGTRTTSGGSSSITGSATTANVSSGFAAATQMPAIMGVMGFLGAIAVL